MAETAVACRVVADALAERRDRAARLSTSTHVTAGMCVVDAPHPSGVRAWPPVICSWTVAEWAPIGELLSGERAR